jgi:hypothetical protein
MKETLEKAACVYRKSTQNQMYIEKIAFVKGAEYQADRMYSEEEIVEIIDNFLVLVMKNEKKMFDIFNEFKKK